MMILLKRIQKMKFASGILPIVFLTVLVFISACSSGVSDTNATLTDDAEVIEVNEVDTTSADEDGAASNLEPAPKVGHPAPEFTLVNLEGEAVSLSDFRGKPVIVNFWATWCGPCRLEMPHLQESFAKHQDEDLVVLAVNLTKDDDPDAIPPFIEEFGLTFPVVLDEDGEMRQLYQLFGQPASVFVDRDGIITEYWQGPINLAFIEERLEKIL